MATNNSSLLSTHRDHHIFDIPQVRVLLVVLYSIIFIFCCVGNLAVVMVVMFHSRMRNMTKFLLGNLAFANLCVGIFCVYQSLTTYLYESWFYGDFMCRMHHFTQSLCHTASVLVLVAIAVERYLVLLHPFKSRQMMTFRRLAALITILWILSAAIASPRLYYFGTIKIRINRQKETICIPKKTLYDSATADTIYFALLYVFPLTIISILYASIAKHLNRSVALRQDLDEAGRIERQRCLSTNRRTETSVQYDGRESARIQPFRLMRKKSRKGAVFSKKRRPSSSSSSSTSASGSPCDIENQISKANGKLPWRLSTCKPKPKCRDDTDVSFATPTEFPPETVQIRDNHESLALRRSKSVSWPRDQDGSPMSRSSTDPMLSATHSPWKHEHVNATAGTDNNTVADTLRSETFTSSTTGRLTVCRLQSNATRIQLNQRLYAIRVLIVIVLTFAVLNLPFHVRKLCLNYLPSYDADSDVNHFLTPLTFLLMYTNCAISPMLYAFLNKKFRQSFLDLIFLRQRRR